MGFTINNIGHLSLPDIGRHFFPFLNGENRLPSCVVNFLLKHDSNIPSFYDKQINNLRFTIDRNDSNGIFVWTDDFIVHTYNNFSEIDVFIPQGYYPQREIMSMILHAYKYTLVYNGAFSIHSAAVEHNGQAVAFCGLSGAGKSTQAHLWEQYLSASPINLDQPCVLFENEFTYLSGSPWSGKEDCSKNVLFPLRAIVFIEQSNENSVTLLSVPEAFSLLYLHNALFTYSDDLAVKYSSIIEKTALNIPVYKLNCTISEQAVKTLYNELFEH